MKKIKVNKIQYFYDNFTIYNSYEYTTFYSTTEYKKYKKYYFFGEFVYKYKKLFEIGIDIENCNYTKVFIQKEINKSFCIYKRQLEIDKGNII